MQTQVKLLLKEQFDLGLLSPICLNVLGKDNTINSYLHIHDKDSVFWHVCVN